MQHTQKHSRGVSLLEVLLVFLIAGIIALLGIEHFGSLRQNEDVAVVKKNAEVLMHAMNTYYRQNCTAPCQARSYKSDLKSIALWPVVWPSDATTHTGKLLPTRLVNASPTNDENYDVGIDNIIINNSTTPPTNLSRIQTNITLTIDYSTTTAEWYKQNLGASTTENSAGKIKLIWTNLPSHTTPSIETNLWILNSELEKFKITYNNNSSSPTQ